jgi:hemolysin III
MQEKYLHCTYLFLDYADTNLRPWRAAWGTAIETLEQAMEPQPAGNNRAGSEHIGISHEMAPAAPILSNALDPIIPPRLRPSLRRPPDARRPHMRGLTHLIALPLSLLATTALVWWVQGQRAELAALVLGSSVALVFATSSALHRIYWPPRMARWVRRIDHAAIYVMIAGVYSASWIGALHGRPISDALLVIFWSGAAIGVGFKLVWIDAPRSLATAGYMVLGLSGVLALPEIHDVAGIEGVVTLLASGASFIAGATVYILRKPEPWPGIFGFHEVFHALVTLGVVLQYLAFALFLLPH